MHSHKRGFLKLSDLDRDHFKDTCMAVTLVLLLIAYFAEEVRFAHLSIVTLVLGMAVPSIFKVPALIWFGFAHVMSVIMSKVLLTLLFYLVVFPVSLLKRVFGQDDMKTSLWRKGKDSVFEERNKLFAETDLESPF